MDRFGLSLYDDLDTKKSDQVAGWSSGIKLLHSQMQLKKANQTQVKRDATKKTGSLNNSYNNETKLKKNELFGSSSTAHNSAIFPTLGPQKSTSSSKMIIKNAAATCEPNLWDVEWQFENEYVPDWPNDYEVAVIELRERRDREKEQQDEERQKRKEERFKRDKDKEDRTRVTKADTNDDERISRAGAAIAPPPALQDVVASVDVTPKTSSGGHGASVAAKIMAKYGFKEGQGLGKQEQGMSIALQVEKTSKRGGRIIHEKELNNYQQFSMQAASHARVHSPPTPPRFDSSALKMSQHEDKSPQPPTQMPQQQPQQPQDNSITQIMKEPSKVVLLRNMVGPGEVDQDLEPEVKDECNTKYGEVIKVLIHELPNGPQDEAVRIFVEFKRIESAIKAVIDLNGRFFGGRQVKAGFYNVSRFLSFHLLD